MRGKSVKREASKYLRITASLCCRYLQSTVLMVVYPNSDSLDTCVFMLCNVLSQLKSMIMHTYYMHVCVLFVYRGIHWIYYYISHAYVSILVYIFYFRIRKTFFSIRSHYKACSQFIYKRIISLWFSSYLRPSHSFL